MGKHSLHHLMPQVCVLRSVVNPTASALFPTQDLKKGVLGHIMDVDPFFFSQHG